jgi:hypothetical protein
VSKIKAIAKTAVKTVSDSSPTILTGIAVTGTATTAYLAAKAGYRAALRIRDEEDRGGTAGDWKQRLRERARLTWTLYIPPAMAGAATIICIVGSNRISSTRAAAAAGAYNLLHTGFQEYKDKVAEVIGENKENRIRDDIATDRMQSDPVSSKEVIITYNGDVLCYDTYTGRYFQSSMNAIKKAENDINYQIIHDVYASLNDFYRKLGIHQVEAGDDLGWDDKIELKITSVVSEDDRPCLAIAFRKDPKRDYYRVF